MKVKTAVIRITQSILQGNYVEAAAMLKKYQRKFGNRHFTYWLRLLIANGLWEHGLK